MRVTLVGGPARTGQEYAVPTMDPPPPFICTGEREPFRHYRRLDDPFPGRGVDDQVYVYAGECLDVDRRGEHGDFYPHQHDDTEG